MATVWKNLLPDMTLPSLQNICWGIRDPEAQRPQPDDTFNAEGVIATFRECLLVYGLNTRDAFLEAWKQLQIARSHLSGGIGNPATLELNFFRHMPGDQPLNSRTIGQWRAAIEQLTKGSAVLPPIFFDYPGAMDRLAKEKGSADPDAVSIGEALKWGAPDFWQMYCFFQSKIVELGKTVSLPFGACQSFGHFLAEEDVKFDGVKIPITISNTTGARGLDSKGINLLLFSLLHGRIATLEAYMREARFTAEELRRRGRLVPFQEDRLEKYAEAFVRTLPSVEQDMEACFHDTGEMQGIQYAVTTFLREGLCIGLAPFPNLPHLAPHAFVLQGEEWKVAE